MKGDGQEIHIKEEVFVGCKLQGFFPGIMNPPDNVTNLHTHFFSTPSSKTFYIQMVDYTYYSSEVGSFQN
jgi:hypothetical protein